MVLRHGSLKMDANVLPAASHRLEYLQEARAPHLCPIQKDFVTKETFLPLGFENLPRKAPRKW